MTLVSQSDTSSKNSTETLGTLFLPKSGTGVGRFSFVVNLDHGDDVIVGAPVTAETREGPIVGVVVDMKTVGTDEDPVITEAARSGGGSSPMREVMIADCQVFGDVAPRPVTAGFVRAATANEVASATGLDRNDWPIPAGCVQLVGGGYAPVAYSGHDLLGPQAGHLLCAGISGQAAKTSYVGFMLRSAISSGAADRQKVAALIVNVKGADMLYLDEPPGEGYELQDSDLELYNAMGVPATPFDDLKVYSPAEPGGQAPRSQRKDAELIRWDLRTIWNSLYQLDPYLFEDDKTAAFVAMFGDTLLKRGVDTFDALDAWMEREIADADAEQRSECWDGRIHIATMRKLRRRFHGLHGRGRGLFTKGKSSAADDIPTTGWEHGHVAVLDIAGLQTDVQGFALARTCQRLLSSAESGTLGVDHLIVFADEMNTFAPAGSSDMSTVKKALGLIAIQGRYAGISLVGAAQKMSKIDDLIRDQAATRAVGVTADAELSSGVYGRLPAGLVERIATLPKGQMALWHYLFRQALIVSFPRPAWRTGKPKTSGASAVDRTLLGSVATSQNISSAALERLTEGLHPDDVADLIVDADDAATAVQNIAAQRIPDMKKTVLHSKPVVDDDPFAILS